jgi:putative Mg2+ transporter-C (MgtC) family protein
MQEILQNLLLTTEYQYSVRILISAFLGMLLGYERALNKKTASFRTFSLVSCASCIFTICSVLVSEMSEISDPGRISAQIVSGVGFVGAGIIYKDRKHGSVEGITTAVMIWFSSALGMLCGFGETFLGIICVVIYIFILTLGKIMHIITEDFKTKE